MDHCTATPASHLRRACYWWLRWYKRSESDGPSVKFPIAIVDIDVDVDDDDGDWMRNVVKAKPDIVVVDVVVRDVDVAFRPN